ncbi:MAG TPA: glycoside hydrolase family 3 N-terminal domain-containing protein [Solirubrobacteraceae bacterium]|nr:glycoside hydrolase family 3 N-terminal domain-containing protein [Solirubrobacteraceae bacterium]
MAERVARVVGETPRRRIGFGAVLGALIAVAVLIAVGVFASAPAAHASSPPHHRHSHARRHDQGSGLSQAQINARVNSLIRRMTVTEKFGQLEMSGPQGPNGTPGQSLINDARNGEVGSVLDLVGVNNINTLQHAALQSRLHIPLIFALDVIHGYKTMFPISLGESSSWDPALAAHDASVAASEAAADGLKWTFSPMVDVTRDPRWGRVEGTSGEDPFLGAALAAARVHGYQGAHFAAPDKMAATVKHFAAYGAVVAGREYNTTDMSIQQLYNDYLPTYKAAVDAGAATVMSAFTSLNGVPDTANPFTLQTILRDEWGFGGTVVSDYQAVQELQDFGYAADQAQAAQEALTAGVDIEMAVTLHSQYSTYANTGPQLLAQGKITMDQLNTAVRHVLTLKYLAGMFAHPYTDPNRVKTAELTPGNLQQARTAADESMVLLNNNNRALPLSTATSSIAVVGPLANDALDQLGPDVPIGYDTTAADLKPVDKISTVLDGIKAAAPNATVTYAQGCDISSGCTSTSGFAGAVAAAKAAAVTVVVVGEPASDSGEASSRSMLGLPGDQLALVQAIAATGKPYVVVLMNGRPLTIPWLATNAPGLLEAWYPGTEGGNAVADLLFGKVNPSGKLPMSFPRDVGQIPISYNELPTGRPYDPNNKYTSKYLDVPNTPQYPFGYGLSYTTFALAPPRLSTTSVSPHGGLTVTETIANTGSRAGTDVVQLYLHESDTTILQPVKKLEGFQRVTLAPGQSRAVTFHLGPQNFGYYDNTGHFVVQGGPFNLWVSDSSDTGTPVSFTLG